MLLSFNRLSVFGMTRCQHICWSIWCCFMRCCSLLLYAEVTLHAISIWCAHINYCMLLKALHMKCRNPYRSNIEYYCSHIKPREILNSLRMWTLQKQVARMLIMLKWAYIRDANAWFKHNKLYSHIKNLKFSYCYKNNPKNTSGI